MMHTGAGERSSRGVHVGTAAGTWRRSHSAPSSPLGGTRRTTASYGAGGYSTPRSVPQGSSHPTANVEIESNASSDSSNLAMLTPPNAHVAPLVLLDSSPPVSPASRRAIAKSAAGTMTFHIAHLAHRNEELEGQLNQLQSSFKNLQAFATAITTLVICIIAIAAWRFA